MLQLIHLVLRIIVTALSLTRQIRSLFKERPFSMPRRNSTIIDIADIPLPKEKDMIEFQIEIETLIHKNQLMPRIRAEFEESPLGFEEHMTKFNVDPDFGFSLLAQMALHKRAHLPTLVGILRNHFDGDCQLTANELLKACQADLMDWDTVSRQFIVRYELSPDVQADLDRYQYPLPMVVPPLEITNNRETGYYINNGSVILRDNHHDNDVCLDHLNRMNKVRYRLNEDVARTIKNKWKSLDKPKPDEEYGEYQKRVRAFQKYNKTAYDVHLHLGIANGGEFWLTHKYDKRGRTYCQGYHVNTQGNTWSKASIEFAEQEIVT
jgi:hypothetical protein